MICNASPVIWSTLFNASEVLSLARIGVGMEWDDPHGWSQQPDRWVIWVCKYLGNIGESLTMDLRSLDCLVFVFLNDFLIIYIYSIIHPTKTASLFGEAKLCHVSHRTWWGFAEGVPQVSLLWVEYQMLDMIELMILYWTQSLDSYKLL